MQRSPHDIVFKTPAGRLGVFLLLAGWVGGWLTVAIMAAANSGLEFGAGILAVFGIPGFLLVSVILIALIGWILNGDPEPWFTNIGTWWNGLKR